MTQRPKAAKTQRKHIYLRVAKMVDPDTGELVGCLVPASAVDRRMMRDRRYRNGIEIRAELKKPRNSKFHRLVHALGILMVDHVEGFSDFDAHEAIKYLQVEANVCCEVQSVNASPIVSAVLKAAEHLLGPAVAKMLEAVLPQLKTIEVKVPQSLSFEEMDEAEFKRLFDRICRHVAETYWPDLDEETIQAMAELMPEGA